MATDLTGFVCALILAALVLAWIAYCMFYKERHRSELHQYDIEDLNAKRDVSKQDKTKLGVFVLPLNGKHNDEEYIKRPDYPECGFTNLSPGDRGAGQLIDILKEDSNGRDKSCDLEVNSTAYHSDV